MTWLWCIFAGFYLVAYSFWVPKIFSSLPLVILALFVTLALGSGLLFDGFSRAMQLQTGSSLRSLPMGRAPALAGWSCVAGVRFGVHSTGRLGRGTLASRSWHSGCRWRYHDSLRHHQQMNLSALTTLTAPLPTHRARETRCLVRMGPSSRWGVRSEPEVRIPPGPAIGFAQEACRTHLCLNHDGA